MDDGLNDKLGKLEITGPEAWDDKHLAEHSVCVQLTSSGFTSRTWGR